MPYMDTTAILKKIPLCIHLTFTISSQLFKIFYSFAVFVFVSSSFQQIKQREHTEKVNLLLSCGQYQMWPKQPVLKVAELIEWMSAPPNSCECPAQTDPLPV